MVGEREEGEKGEVNSANAFQCSLHVCNFRQWN